MGKQVVSARYRSAKRHVIDLSSLNLSQLTLTFIVGNIFVFAVLFAILAIARVLRDNNELSSFVVVSLGCVWCLVFFTENWIAVIRDLRRRDRMRRKTTPDKGDLH